MTGPISEIQWTTPVYELVASVLLMGLGLGMYLQKMLHERKMRTSLPSYSPEAHKVALLSAVLEKSLHSNDALLRIVARLTDAPLHPGDADAATALECYRSQMECYRLILADWHQLAADVSLARDKGQLIVPAAADATDQAVWKTLCDRAEDLVQRAQTLEPDPKCPGCRPSYTGSAESPS